MSLGFIAALCVAAISFTALILIYRGGGQSWKSRLSSFFLLFLITGASVFMLYDAGIFGRKKINRNFHVSEFEAARAFVLGKFISEGYPGFNIVIISGTDDSDREFYDVRIESLKKGLGPGVKILALVNFEAERNKQGYLQYSKNITSIDFDLLLAKYDSCGIMISILSLPNDFRKMKMFSYSESEKLGLAVLNGQPEKYSSEVKKGNIIAFTCVRPMWTFTPDIPRDPIKAFDLRYLLIYPDNVDDMMRKYPSVFRK
jgi:hypothetical protein